MIFFFENPSIFNNANNFETRTFFELIETSFQNVNKNLEI